MIKQGRVSKALHFNFLKKFKLKDYGDTHAPCVFFGCYKGRNDLGIILNHKGLVVLCWGGTDILGMTPEDFASLRKDNIKHIAISRYIGDDLNRQGFKYRSVPITAAPLRFNPVPLGISIYTYLDKRRPDFYGEPIIRLLEDRYDIIRGTGDIPKEKMGEVYSRCFLGLRLTKHDGLPNTVVEMGLMGRRCVYNGLLPNAINYKSTADIINAIEHERKKIGMVQFDVARKMFDYLNIGNTWLDEKTYV